MLDGSFGLCRLLGDLRRSGKFRIVPSPSEGGNKLDARGHLRHLRIEQCLLVVQQGSLSDDHIEIRIDPGLISPDFKLQGTSGNCPPSTPSAGGDARFACVDVSQTGKVFASTVEEIGCALRAVPPSGRRVVKAVSKGVESSNRLM